MMFNLAVKAPTLIFTVAMIASVGIPILFYVGMQVNINTSQIINPPKDVNDYLNNPRYSYSRGQIIFLIIAIAIGLLASLFSWISD